jgi:hypothetical protein
VFGSSVSKSFFWNKAKRDLVVCDLPELSRAEMEIETRIKTEQKMQSFCIFYLKTAKQMSEFKASRVLE